MAPPKTGVAIGALAASPCTALCNSITYQLMSFDTSKFCPMFGPIIPWIQCQMRQLTPADHPISTVNDLCRRISLQSCPYKCNQMFGFQPEKYQRVWRPSSQDPVATKRWLLRGREGKRKGTGRRGRRGEESEKRKGGKGVATPKRMPWIHPPLQLHDH